MSRFVFELATPEDSEELLEILEEAGFEGNISLLYTRRPDVYHSIKAEGSHVDIVVCRDTRHNTIVGFGACAIHRLFVNSVPADVGYLFGLRIRRVYRKKFPLLHRGYAFLRDLHIDKNLPFYLTSILADSHDVQRLFERSRACMPTFQPFSNYKIYTIKTTWPRSSSLRQFHFRQACHEDLPQLMEFFTQQGQQEQFFPVLTADDFQETHPNGLSSQNFYLLTNTRHEIIAAGALWDQRAYKQYVVQGYRGLLKLLYPISRWFPLLGFPALPAPKSILHFFTLAFWTVKDHRPETFHCFLNHLAAHSQAYPFFLVGILEGHPLQPVLQKRPHISYRSRLYLVYWEGQQQNVDKLDSHMLPYLECGML